MLQEERNTRRPSVSRSITHARLTRVLVLLFTIALVADALFPHAVPGAVLVILARLLELVISAAVRRSDA
ncbi:MAG: hypothetical protein HC911_17415 [Chloroflexaceae bacterium]|nr:hypothetical protein [Chloroflexaceae bacterium]